MSAVNIVEAKVLRLINDWYHTLKTPIKGKKPPEEIDVASKRQFIEKKESEISELKTQKNNLHDLLERGVYTIDTFVEREQNLSLRIAAVEKEVENVKREIEREELRLVTSKELLPLIKKVIESYDQMPTEGKNVLLKSVLHKVEYRRDKDSVDQNDFHIKLFTKI